MLFKLCRGLPNMKPDSELRDVNHHEKTHALSFPTKAINIEETHKTSSKQSCKENNNNFCNGSNLVQWLNLKTDEIEEQHSNSSSLESTNSLSNQQGSHGCNEEGESGSTSCSEDSFEMSSTCSAKDCFNKDRSNEYLQNLMLENSEKFEHNATLSSQSPRIFENFATSDAFNRIRNSVAQEIDELDTGLPHLDFEKLEQKLELSAKEREYIQTREPPHHCLSMCDIRNRSDDPCSVPRLTTFTNSPNRNDLKVCFMNRMNDHGAEYEEDTEDSDNDSVFQQNESASNLKYTSTIPTELIKFPSSLKLCDMLNDDQRNYENARCEILQYETDRIVKLADKVSQDALMIFRRNQSKASEMPRQARQYLSKMKLVNIHMVYSRMKNAINHKNKELVDLLMERDNLHMEHDSLKLDIDDYTMQKSPLVILDIRKLMMLQTELNATILKKVEV